MREIERPSKKGIEWKKGINGATKTWVVHCKLRASKAAGGCAGGTDRREFVELLSVTLDASGQALAPQVTGLNRVSRSDVRTQLQPCFKLHCVACHFGMAMKSRFTVQPDQECAI